GAVAQRGHVLHRGGRRRRGGAGAGGTGPRRADVHAPGGAEGGGPWPAGGEAGGDQQPRRRAGRAGVVRLRGGERPPGRRAVPAGPAERVGEHRKERLPPVAAAGEVKTIMHIFNLALAAILVAAPQPP